MSNAGTDMTVHNAPSDLVPRARGQMAARDTMGSELAQSDAGTSAITQAAVAEVQAQYVMARRFPRNIDDVRVDVLRECERSSFAAVAIYIKPIGKGVEGLSIRFVEAALNAMGNVRCRRFLVSDDEKQRVVRVVVNDLQKNTPFEEDVVIDKTQERSTLKEGQRPLGQRVNSFGKLVYLVPATEDEVAMKEANFASKALRRQGLKVIPGWLQAEAKERLYETRESDVRRDPDGERHKLVDAFAKFGLKASDLEEFLGHELVKSTPKELVELRGAWLCLRDGEGSWKELLDMKREERGEVPPADDGEKKAPNAGATALREKLAAKGKKAAKDAAPAAGTAAAPATPPSSPGAQTDEERAAAIDKGQA